MKNTDKGKSKTLLYGITIFLLCTIIVMQVLAQEQNRNEMKPATTGWQHLAFTYTISETPKAELARKNDVTFSERLVRIQSLSSMLLLLPWYYN